MDEQNSIKLMVDVMMLSFKMNTTCMRIKLGLNYHSANTVTFQQGVAFFTRKNASRRQRRVGQLLRTFERQVYRKMKQRRQFYKLKRTDAYSIKEGLVCLNMVLGEVYENSELLENFMEKHYADKITLE